jgi:hypothetical protein
MIFRVVDAMSLRIYATYNRLWLMFFGWQHIYHIIGIMLPKVISPMKHGALLLRIWLLRVSR